MGAGTNSSNVEGGICIVYSKRTAKLVNSVALTPDGKSANVASGSNLRSGGDVELGGVTNQKTGRQRFRLIKLLNYDKRNARNSDQPHTHPYTQLPEQK